MKKVQCTSRMRIIGILVAVLTLFCGAVAVRSTGYAAETPAADTVEREITRREVAYEGLAFKGNGVSGNKKAALCIDLTPNLQEGLSLPAGDKYLTISFTALRNTASAQSGAADAMATVFFLEDSAGNRVDTVYAANPGYKAPVLEYKSETPNYATAQMNQVGLYYRVSSSRQLAKGTAFIPFSAFTARGEALTDVKYLMLAQDLGNPWRWLELTEIAVTTLPDYTVSMTGGTFVQSDRIPAAPDVAAAFEQNKRVLYDFTQVREADVAANFANGVYTSMVADSREAVARASCTTDSAEYLRYLALERKYEEVIEKIYVDVKTDLVGALRIAPDPQAQGTQNTDETVSLSSVF